MSDDPRLDADSGHTLDARSDDPPVYRCSICGEYANFSEGTRLLEGRIGTWYCPEHWRERERLRKLSLGGA
jgi:hypothetical protein